MAHPIAYHKVFYECFVKNDISFDFSYKTIERNYDPKRSRELLEEIFKITNEIDNANEKEFNIDDTEDPCTIKVNYESKEPNNANNSKIVQVRM